MTGGVGFCVLSSPAQAGDPVNAGFAMGQRSYWVYILASQLGGTLYIGITSDLIRRVYQHREQQTRGFTKRYGVTRLVYFEQYDDPENAIRREKRLKKWTRAWKIQLIEKDNPNWDDLYPRLAKG